MKMIGIIFIVLIFMLVGYILGASLGFPMNNKKEKTDRIGFMSLLQEKDDILIYDQESYMASRKQKVLVVANDPTQQLIQLKEKNSYHEPIGYKYKNDVFRDIIGDNLIVIKGRVKNKSLTKN